MSRARAAPTVALVGNPNCGKSTLFNRLTGLRQRTGNFPGVTVERRSGTLSLPGGLAEVVDLPGTYSLHPASLDERVVLERLLGADGAPPPDAIVFVADVNKLDKHLLLLTQVCDLGLPVLLALNFIDELPADSTLDLGYLSRALTVPVVAVSARDGEGVVDLEEAVARLLDGGTAPTASFYEPSALEDDVEEALATALPRATPYARLLAAQHADNARWPAAVRIARNAAVDREGFDAMRLQVRETMQRYDRFLPVLEASRRPPAAEATVSDRIDRWATHPIAGPLLFFGLLFLVFTAIFEWASYPMELIEALFASVGDGVRALLPYSASSGEPLGYLADFLVDGVLAGLGGVAVFVPQIAILFFLITVMEEAGYMARAVFLFDRLMQRFGLNGRSLVALTSSGACAIPAIMSARTISNPRERLITILVSPLISCSARIPVYAILIGFAVPAVTVWGVFNAQALAFFAIYLASIAAALLSALAFKYLLKSRERSYLMIELPAYRMPVWRNVFTTAWIKTRAFLFGAGKIILAISMVLWALASFGPGDAVAEAESAVRRSASAQDLAPAALDDAVANARLEASYAGVIGHAIEPAIRPLGYDWRIGIALVTSFAAREVFVGTIATLYAIGSADDDEARIVERLTEAKRVDGTQVYTAATALSLIVFYLFAMQCMSTLAVVRRETGTWRWPLVQTLYMTGLAYGGAYLAYQWLS